MRVVYEAILYQIVCKMISFSLIQRISQFSCNRFTSGSCKAQGIIQLSFYLTTNLLIVLNVNCLSTNTCLGS